jgi:HD-GYP domain-containing protein (c-di-GMP phosphodiesterase class II)
VNPQIIKDITEILETELNAFEAETNALAEIRKHDEYTYLHCLNVARLSVMLGKRLGLEKEMLVDLGWAALLHDLGKLHVPLDVLNKVKKFTPEELSIMQSHPLESVAVFANQQPVNIDSIRRLSAAFEHHQRYDLKGYPRVKEKLNLHPFSRIVAVADTYDAMTTDRIYQRRILPDVALRIMSQGFGTIFDPTVLQAFITSMGAYPAGTLIRLNDDRLAVVIDYHEHSKLDRPVIRPADDHSAEDIDLMDDRSLHLKIVRSEFPEDHGVEVGRFVCE